MNSELIEILQRIFIVSQLPVAVILPFIGYFISKSVIEIDDEIPVIDSFLIKFIGYLMFPSSVILLISFFQNI